MKEEMEHKITEKEEERIIDSGGRLYVCASIALSIVERLECKMNESTIDLPGDRMVLLANLTMAMFMSTQFDRKEE